MRKYLLAGACAISAAATLGVAQAIAQQQATPPSPTSQSQPTAMTPQAATTTLVGCLYREQDVPGRQPNVAERTGVMEDYILADARTAEQSGSATGTSGSATGTSGTTPAAGKMYKVEKIADEQLRALVGKRVEVTGSIDADANKESATGTPGAAKPDQNPASPDAIDLPEFEAASIREVSGSCPPKPKSPVR